MNTEQIVVSDADGGPPKVATLAQALECVERCRGGFSSRCIKTITELLERGDSILQA